MTQTHEPVLLEEVIRSLLPDGHMHINKGVSYVIDATLGAGGYTKRILEEEVKVLGIDIDPVMLEIARNNINDQNAKLVHGNFTDLAKIAKENGLEKVDGIVFDLGVSNVHFTDEERGFSFKNPDADLDMRLDPSSQGVKASDLLNVLREDQLKEILGANLAKKAVEFRKVKKFEKVKDFSLLFGNKDNVKVQRINPMTVPMMNLRIAVNSELTNLKNVLPQAWDLLKPNGRLVVVSFHSGEDEIVKDFIRSKGGKNEFVCPTDDEVRRNPKSRSAKLRFITKNE